MGTMRILWAAFSLLLLLSPRGAAAPPGLGTLVERALERAGENGKEIGAFLEGLSGEKLQAGRFLVAFMPVADLASLDARALRENLDLAFRARREFPWGKKVPFSLFVHYVLPHRFAQEAFQPWRPFFFREMKALLQGRKGMGEAVRAANHWCARRVKFIQTEWRDQTPLDTIRSGYGRCEEMMEVTLAALRAAAIPARPCSAPWWVVNDNNHAWVEVWVDGAWHYIGGCEDTPLDRTWFRGPARRAGMVVSVMYGAPGFFDTGDRVYKVLPDAALINSTGVYTRTGTLRVRVLDPRGRPVPGAPFAVSVFNFGGLRALTRRAAGPDGKVSVELGPGEFFLSAGKGRERAYRVIQSRPGAETRAVLRLREGAVPPRAFFLRYPTSAEADRLAAALPSRRSPAKDGFRPRPSPPPVLDLYEPGKDPDLDGLFQGFSGKEDLEKILADARGAWRNAAAGLKALGKDLLPPALEFLKRTAHLDRVEMTPAILLDHVRWAVKTRRKEVPPGVFHAWVLNGRIDLENLGPWRERLARRFSGMLRWEPPRIAAALSDWARRNLKSYPRGRFGPYMNPGQVLTSRRAVGRERAIFLAGVFRSLGVPARKRPNQDDVEYWTQGGWRSLSLRAGKGSGKGGAPSVRVTLSLRKGGRAFFSSRAVAFSRFSGGAWNPLRRLPFRKRAGRLEVSLPPGEYLFTAGTRNGNGDPWVQCLPLRLRSGVPLSAALCLDLPPWAGIFRFPVCRRLKTLPVIRAGGRVLDTAAWSRKGPILLFLFLPGHEPSVRAVAMVRSAFPELRKAGVRGMGVLLPGEGSVPQGALPFPVLRAGWDAARALGMPGVPGDDSRLPSILLLQKGGKPLLWVEGYDTRLEALLKGAARMIRP